MKRFPLLPLVALVFAAAYACTDSTAPANAPTLLARNASVVLGDPPPPPVDAAINITISSHPAEGAFDGVYFSQGETAWLRLNNTQSDVFGTSASANARFKASGDVFTGKGTLMIDGQEVVINAVTSFFANPNCRTTGESCATITFDATVDGETGHTGTAEAFNINSPSCHLVFVSGGEGGQGSHFIYRCGD
jgi:hypothetical protein